MSKAKEFIDKAFKSLEQRLYSKASVEFSMAIDQEPTKAIPEIKKMFEAAAFDYHFETAISLGLALLNQNPTNYKLANRLGNYARKTGNTDQAIGLYKHCIKIDPSYKYAFYNLGATLSKSELADYEAVQAVDYFPATLKFLFPYYFYVDDKGSYFIAEKFEERLFEIFDKYFSLNHKTDISKIVDENEDMVNRIVSEFQSHLAAVYRKNLEESAKSLNQESRTTEVRHEMSQAFSSNNSQESTKSKENDKSETSLLKSKNLFYQLFDFLIQFDHKNQQLHCYNKLIYSLKNDTEEKARQVFRTVTYSSSVYPLGYLEMISAYFHMLDNNYKDAESIMNTLVGKNPTNRYFTINLGLIYRGSKQFMRSYRYLIKGFELLKKNEYTVEILDYISKVNCRFLLGQVVMAKKQLKQLIEEKVPFGSVYFNMATILLQEKKYLDAVALFKRSLNYDKSLEEIVTSQVNKIKQALVTEGDFQFNSNKLRPAKDNYYAAYKIEPDKDTIKKLIECLEGLDLDQNDINLRKELKTELREMEKGDEEDLLSKKQIKQVEAMNKNRRSLIQLAEMNMKRKKYYNAIDFYESAFRIKPDKEVFVKLVSLYKGMGKSDKLIEVADRYRIFLKHEEKMKHFDEKSTIKVQ